MLSLFTFNDDLSDIETLKRFIIVFIFIWLIIASKKCGNFGCLPRDEATIKLKN